MVPKPREGVDPDDDIMIDIKTQRRYKKGEPLMNGDRARQQLERIQAMVKESRSNCTIELEPTSAVDSVYLTFHCGAQMHRVQWVGAWLESLTPTALWHELDIATRGAIKKPTT